MSGLQVPASERLDLIADLVRQEVLAHESGLLPFSELPHAERQRWRDLALAAVEEISADVRGSGPLPRGTLRRTVS